MSHKTPALTLLTGSKVGPKSGNGPTVITEKVITTFHQNMLEGKSSEQPHLRQGEVLPITVGVVCLNVSSVKLQKVLVTDPYVKAQNVSIEKGYRAIQHVLFFSLWNPMKQIFEHLVFEHFELHNKN